MRTRFARQMGARWRRITKVVRESIVDMDCFGIQDRPILVVQAAPTQPREFYPFTRTEDKVAAFMDWLRRQEEDEILQVITIPGARRATTAWSDVFIQSAYQKGIVRGRHELIGAGARIPSFETIYGGVSAVMNQPFHADRLGVMFTRVFDDLKTVTEQANGEARRRLIDGLTTGLTRGIAEGKNPILIGKEIADAVNDRLVHVGLYRSRLIARTEIIRAHHLATIGEYRQAAIEEVLVQAEWSTAGDTRVCKRCEQLELEGPFTLDEIEPMIPRHPHCRCVALPIIPEPGIPPPTPPGVPPPTPPVRPPRPRRPRRPRRPTPPPEPTPEPEGPFTGDFSSWVDTEDVTELAADFDRRFNIGLDLDTLLATETATKARRFANVIGKTMSEDMLARFPKLRAKLARNLDRSRLRKLILFGEEIHGERPSIAGLYNGDLKRIRMSGLRYRPDMFTPELQIGQLRAAFTVGGDYATTFRHEYGHHLWTVLGSYDRSEWQRLFDIEIFRARISKYSSTNVYEGFAEAFSAYTSPLYGTTPSRRLPTQVETFFERVLGMREG